jgi:hypothetical protein
MGPGEQCRKPSSDGVPYRWRDFSITPSERFGRAPPKSPSSIQQGDAENFSNKPNEVRYQQLSRLLFGWNHTLPANALYVQTYAQGILYAAHSRAMIQLVVRCPSLGFTEPRHLLVSLVQRSAVEHVLWVEGPERSTAFTRLLCIHV